MNPKEWKILRDELLARGLEVKVSGKQKKEYIASTDYMLVDILRGGVTHSGMNMELVVYSIKDDQIVYNQSYRNYRDILDVVDHYIEDYNQFGDII